MVKNAREKRMEMHKRAIIQILEENLWLGKLNIYHEHVFEIQRITINKFVQYELLFSMIMLFIGIVFNEIFILIAMGSLCAGLLFLLFDKRFLSRWKTAIMLLRKSGERKNAN